MQVASQLLLLEPSKQHLKLLGDAAVVGVHLQDRRRVADERTRGRLACQLQTVTYALKHERVLFTQFAQILVETSGGCVFLRLQHVMLLR